MTANPRCCDQRPRSSQLTIAIAPPPASRLRAHRRQDDRRGARHPRRATLPHVRVRFAAYRRYKESLVAADDAMMGLLIGARLGEHSLRSSAADPDRRLPDLYGLIPDIQRFNRTVSDAARLLGGAEHHLASMGIPYVLGVHGAFMVEAIDMLRQDGRDEVGREWSVARRIDTREIPLSEIHEYFEERSGVRFPEALLQLFHFARRIRNRIVHFGGNAGSRLQSEYRTLPKQTRDQWVKVAGRAVTVAADGKLELAAGELHAALAFTRGLAREANDALAVSLSRHYWLRTIVDDYRRTSPQNFGERDRRVRRIVGYAHTLYRPLDVRVDEIREVLSEEW